jgi:hypothetical protein
VGVRLHNQVLGLTNINRFTAVVVLSLLAVTLGANSIASVSASPGQGSFVLVAQGYSVNGNLQNAVNVNNSVSMNMVLDGNVQTPIGAVPMTANGVWVGVVNGSEVSGTIQNVSGTAHICFLFWCGNANFVGEGKWSGTLASEQGSGGYSGTITFTSSDWSQIPVGKPQPVSGTWNAEFQSST